MNLSMMETGSSFITFGAKHARALLPCARSGRSLQILDQIKGFKERIKDQARYHFSMHDQRIQKLEHAKKMVAVFEEQLSTGAEIFSVSIDGAYVQYQREAAVKELEMWRKQVIRYSRAKSRFSTFNLGNSHGP